MNSNKSKMIFVVGNSRSGTTMLGRILGLHSEVYTFDELHFFEHLVDATSILEKPDWTRGDRQSLLERLLTTEREYRHFFAKVETGKYTEEASAILSKVDNKDPLSVYEAFLRYETCKNNKSIPCEQTPRYLYFVQEIMASFEGALFINIIRDPRDVLLSQKNKWRRRYLDERRTPLFESLRSWANYHPYTISRLWKSSVNMAKKLESENRFISIKFEDLLDNPEQIIRDLCSFLSIEYNKEMLEVSQIGSSRGIDAPDKLGVDKSKSSNWSKGGLSAVELATCQKITSNEMRALGYKEHSVKVRNWILTLSMLGAFLKLSIALLMNLGRTKNLLETLRRRLS